MIRSRLEDLGFETKKVRIREKKKDRTRTLTYRWVPMSPLFRQVMSDWCAQHPDGGYTFCCTPNVKLKQTLVTKSFRRCLRGTKWIHLRGFHVLRHSFASNLAAARVDQRVIDEFMGHQTEDMRRRYRHLFPDPQQRAIELVFPMNGRQAVI